MNKGENYLQKQTSAKCQGQGQILLTTRTRIFLLQGGHTGLSCGSPFYVVFWRCIFMNTDHDQRMFHRNLGTNFSLICLTILFILVVICNKGNKVYYSQTFKCTTKIRNSTRCIAQYCDFKSRQDCSEETRMCRAEAVVIVL